MDLRWLPQKAPDTTPRGTHPSDLAVMLSKPAAEDGPRLKAPEEMQRRPSELAESTSDMLMKLMEARSSVQSEPLPDTKPPPRPASRLVLQPTTVPKAAPRPSDGPAQKLSEAEQFAEELNLQPLQPLTLATVEGNYVDIPSVASPAAAPKPLPAVPVIMPSRPMPQSALPASIMSAPPIKENPPQTEYGALPLSLPSDDEGLVTPPPNHSFISRAANISPRSSPRQQQLSLSSSTIISSMDNVRQPARPNSGLPQRDDTVERSATFVRPPSPLPKPPSPRPLAASADALLAKPMPRPPSPIPGKAGSSREITRSTTSVPTATGPKSNSFRQASPRPHADNPDGRSPSPLPNRDNRAPSPRPDRIILGGTRANTPAPVATAPVATAPSVPAAPKSPKGPPKSPPVPRSTSNNELGRTSRDSITLVTNSPWIIDQSELTLGGGVGGVVYQGLWRDGDVAIKQISRSAMSSSEVEDFCKEAELMINLRPHTNVVRFLGFCLKPSLCIVTEYIEGGSLKEHLRSLTTPLEMRVVVKLLRSVAAGVNHLHREGVVHRDLAARNILTDKNLSVIRVSDFGLSRFLSAGDKGITTRNTGPLKWMAPECLSGREYSTKSDAYAFGVLAWEILTRSDPWPDLEPHTAAIRVMQHKMRLPVPADTPPELRLLFNDCWNEQPSLRPDFPTIGSRLVTLEASLAP